MPSACDLTGNPSLRDAFRAAEALGCALREKRGNGETLVYHPSWPHTITVNHRRKDTPRVLLIALRRLQQPGG